MKYCHKCSQQLSDDAEFCIQCGAKQQTQSDHAVNEVSFMNDDSVRKPSVRKSSVHKSSTARKKQTSKKKHGFWYYFLWVNLWAGLFWILPFFFYAKYKTKGWKIVSLILLGFYLLVLIAGLSGSGSSSAVGM